MTDWSETLTAAGHDLPGDLETRVGDKVSAGLLGDGLVDGGSSTPHPRDQLAVAVGTLADALAENSTLRAAVAGLEADRDRLDREGRKLKRRFDGGTGPG